MPPLEWLQHFNVYTQYQHCYQVMMNILPQVMMT